MKKNSTPTHRECFPLVHQRPEQDDRPRTTTRDSGEHFPAFNVAIRHDGVKKSGKADFLDADYASQVGSRALAELIAAAPKTKRFAAEGTLADDNVVQFGIGESRVAYARRVDIISR